MSSTERVTESLERTGGVQSLDRAFGLLEHMAAADGDLALSELATRSGLPLPTIHRIVRTLVASGYVRQLPSRRYGLGPRLIGLGDAASRMLGSWAQPQLAALVDAVGETANMAMLDGDAVVYVAQVPSRHSMRMFTEVGRRVPVHCTGVGKVLLAQLPVPDVRGLLARTGMAAQTPHTITDPDRLLRELDKIREQGYAVDDAEQELGVRCVAVAVHGGPSRTAVSVSGPETRVTWTAVEAIAPLLHSAAAALAAELSGRPVSGT
ncbi:IclR family transcriptional regulator [Pseudonocardia saturnea]